MKVTIFDIEANGLLDDVTEVICISYMDMRSLEMVTAHGPGAILKALDVLENSAVLIGHNILAYDIEVLKKLYPWWRGPKGSIKDTLVMARLAYPDRRHIDVEERDAGNTDLPPNFFGSHSLKAWGYRLGMHKGDYMETLVEDYKKMKYNDSLREYCEQDVRVTESLYAHLHKDAPWMDETDSLQLEHEFAQCIAAQVRNGFAFDEDRAAGLYSHMSQMRDDLVVQLQAEVPPTIIELKTKTKSIPFNPGSRKQIGEYLQSQGWVPEVFTETGQPKVDESVLDKIDHPVAAKLSQYLMLQKRIGMLAEGTEAWMKVARDSSNGFRVYGSVNHNGAVTGRCTHRSPNMAQVPAVYSPFGKECRSLFIAPPGRVLVGVDAAGLELRCLGHYMAKYDNGEFVNTLLNGDIHTANQEAAGLPTRDAAKVFIYAFLYGAGPAKLGSIVGGGYNEGKEMQKRFLAKMPALAQLKKDVEINAQLRGYLIGLDGRRLRIRSAHAALNTLLQSAGALIMKKATILMNREISKHSLDAIQVGHIHDEVQFECKEAHADLVSKIVKACIEDAGTSFNLRCPLAGEAKIGANWAETH